MDCTENEKIRVGGISREQGNLTRLLSFFKNRESRLKMDHGTIRCDFQHGKRMRRSNSHQITISRQLQSDTDVDWIYTAHDRFMCYGSLWNL
jgi:hypothetical protein